MQGNVIPPELPGYTYLRTLGQGSTATVYLYRQHTPRRDVAVKVSTATLDGVSRQRFHTEADRMAQLSSHPYILSVYDVGVTYEGQDYIVFEYAPGGTYKAVMRARSMNADQVLDLGIKLASALYTAHRAGIVHRDIKPNNVLVSATGQPVLADFGVSATIYQSGVTTGHSPAWAAPEVISGATGGTVASDIYSLGATLFAMLAGASPFEYGYRVSSRRELIRTILNEPLPALGRPDVPEQVEQVLRKAMARDPEARYFTAFEFARAMQRVQMETYRHATPVVAQDMPPYPRNMRRAAFGSPERDDGMAPRWRIRKRTVAIVAAVIAVVAAVAVVFAVAVVPHLDTASTGERTVTDAPGVASGSGTTGGESDDGIQIARAVPAPDHLEGVYDGDDVTFTWHNPDPQDGDAYAWTIMEGDAAEQSVQSATTEETSVTLQDVTDPQICLSVSIVRQDQSMSQEPAIACAVKR